MDKPRESYEKRGDLKEGFRVFRLSDAAMEPIPFHYHDFHKILVFLSGNVDYTIEGRTWTLSPRDLVFVRAGEIHRPEPEAGVPYERIVIYVAPSFFEQYKRGTEDLSLCFEGPVAEAVVHLAPGKTHDLLFHLEKLEQTTHAKGFANPLYVEMLFVEFLILLNRAMLKSELDPLAPVLHDEKIQQVIKIINARLEEPLSIDALAAEIFVSRSYLMHCFKEATGCTIQQYIKSKRLLKARLLLLHSPDETLDTIARTAGFDGYLPFFRAFKKEFGKTPQEWKAENIFK